MDIGELKNPFSKDTDTKNTQTGTRGPFKIGDYDEKSKPKPQSKDDTTQDDRSLTEHIKDKLTK